MRSLKLLKRTSTSNVWENHQLKAIAAAVKKSGGIPDGVGELVIEPLFPGSYLCNQVVFLESGADGNRVEHHVDEPALDTIYESLSYSTNNSYGRYILIDSLHLDKATKSQLFDVVCQHMEGVELLLVLDRSMQQEIEKLFNEVALKVQGVNPEWSNAARVLSLFRNARHCIFMDNYRVMDAAVCDCPLTLISSFDFAKQQSTNTLWNYLEGRLNCCLTGALSATSGLSVVAVVENNLVEFQRVLKGEPVAVYADWLDEYRMAPEHSRPVIERRFSVWYGPARNLQNLRLSVRRKSLKLAEDPKRFCSDSRNPILKQLGKLIPSREVAQ